MMNRQASRDPDDRSASSFPFTSFPFPTGIHRSRPPSGLENLMINRKSIKLLETRKKPSRTLVSTSSAFPSPARSATSLLFFPFQTVLITKVCWIDINPFSCDSFYWLDNPIIPARRGGLACSSNDFAGSVSRSNDNPRPT